MGFFGSFFGSFFGGGATPPTPPAATPRRTMLDPRFTPFTLWASILTQDFPDDIIPIIRDEAEWRSWGNIVSSSTTFARAGVPRTETFSTPLEWATRCYAILG